MADTPLSTLGILVGWGKGTTSGTTKTAPTAFTLLEGCVSIDGVEISPDKIDVTALEDKAKKYVAGHVDTGGELKTTFYDTDSFRTAWAALVKAYDEKSSSEDIWLCAYHPGLTNMYVYIIEPPATMPTPELAVGNALSLAINNVLVDLPDPIKAVKPTA